MRERNRGRRILEYIGLVIMSVSGVMSITGMIIDNARLLLWALITYVIGLGLSWTVLSKLYPCKNNDNKQR